MKLRLLTPAALCLLATPAFAGQHWGDTVTYLRLPGAGHPNCVMFQTKATGGVLNVDNSPAGNAAAAGFTGKAQWNVVGVSQTALPTTATLAYTSGLMGQIVGTARYSNGTFTMDWNDAGVNTTAIYPDCPTGTAHEAAESFGQ